MKKRKHTYQTAASIVAGVALASALVLSTAGSLDADAATRVENLEPTRSVKVDKSKFFHLAPILDVTLAPDGKALLLQLAFKSPATYSIILDGQECGRGEVNESGAAKRLERIPFDLRESEWLLKVDYTLRGVENLHSDETLDGCLIRLLKVTWQNGKAQIEVIKLDDTAAIVKHPETEPVTETKEEDIFANYNANLQNSAKAKEVAKAWGNNMATLIKPGRRSGVVIDGKDEYAKGKVHADGLGSVVVDKNARVVGPIINKTEQKSSVVINRTGASSVNVGSLAKDTGTINASVNTIGASSIVASRATSSIEVGSLSNTNSSTMNVGTIHIHENDEVVRPLSTDREQYAELPASPVRLTLEHPVSTFSIDVDTGAYSNIRRFLNSNRLPPRDAVRIEELVNYFDYEYPLSSNGTPFSVSTEIFDSPFKKEAKILKIALRADDRKTSELPPANLVFLVDVSGSMYADNKLPLVKQTLYILTGQLRPQDKVAIVTYASGEKLALPSTSGGNKAEILRVIDSLQAGGATAGEQAIQMAYREAEKSYIKDGINRIILATDGDFNVGISDRNALTSMVAEKRKSGISLSALGYGTDNYNEAMMEKIADAGNGNFFYIDSRREAKKVVGRELSATLMTVAQDVKIQVEFNPATVREYRLIGYENRQLKREDFNNDKVDAGEIGAGAKVTAFYEFIPAGEKGWIDDSRYAAAPAINGKGDEYAYLKLRYKLPGDSKSNLLEQPVAAQSKPFSDASSDSRFALAVAAYGEALRGGEYNGSLGWDDIHKLASGAKSPDPYGDRAEFIDLIEIAKSLSSGKRQEDIPTNTPRDRY